MQCADVHSGAVILAGIDAPTKYSCCTTLKVLSTPMCFFLLKFFVRSLSRKMKFKNLYRLHISIVVFSDIRLSASTGDRHIEAASASTMSFPSS
jgi:hypothetical protein